jgi:hypothetical protein
MLVNMPSPAILSGFAMTSLPARCDSMACRRRFEEARHKVESESSTSIFSPDRGGADLTFDQRSLFPIPVPTGLILDTE